MYSYRPYLILLLQCNVHYEKRNYTFVCSSGMLFMMEPKRTYARRVCILLDFKSGYLNEPNAYRWHGFNWNNMHSSVYVRIAQTGTLYLVPRRHQKRSISISVMPFSKKTRVWLSKNGRAKSGLIIILGPRYISAVNLYKYIFGIMVL